MCVTHTNGAENMTKAIDPLDTMERFLMSKGYDMIHTDSLPENIVLEFSEWSVFLVIKKISMDPRKHAALWSWYKTAGILKYRNKQRAVFNKETFLKVMDAAFDSELSA